MDLAEIHKVLLNFEKRAENKPDEIIEKTFVDAEPLLDILQAPISQVIFGRRGTGKTHALKYCFATAKERGDSAVYLDIRSIGSNGSYYSDGSIAPVERGLRLVNDILSALLDDLYTLALTRIDQGMNAKQITIRLDDFSEALGNIKVIGTISQEHRQFDHSRVSRLAGGTAKVNTSGVQLDLDASSNSEGNKETETIEKVVGEERRAIDFAQTQVALSGLLDVLGVKRLWLFLDEWSETPRAVQPFLADLVRKTILPIGKVIVKIGAIEQRSSFVRKMEFGFGEYIGLELGADISADLNLDEFLVFDFDEAKSLYFFENLFIEISSLLAIHLYPQ